MPFSQATVQAFEAIGLLVLLPLGILCLAAVRGPNTERVLSESRARETGVD